MTNQEFRKYAHELVDWMADYLENLEQYPVKPPVKPGDIKAKLPHHAPEQGEAFEQIFQDFKDIIVPGMTHWQHPKYFAYFPAMNSEPSILAEMLTATLGAQCMIWLTSPAAEELEERTMEWLRDMLGLPQHFTGVIQDTASTATLVALLTAREVASDFRINQSGWQGDEKYRIYASTQAHSSIDKAVRIAGFGIDNLIKIGVDENYAMIPSQLAQAIRQDIRDGYRPLCVVSCIGTTSSTAIDPVESIATIAKLHGLWHHVDAAYAGSALLLPELRWMSKGLESADSFVFNPHKWMLTNFDCSAYFVRDKMALVNTFSILPEYLKTDADKEVNNYRDWGIQLGRRFRALKLWFVIRSYGIEGLREKIRQHIEWAQWLKMQVEQAPDFELMAPVPLNLVCFRYHPTGVDDEAELESINSTLLQKLNDSGKIFLTQTKLNGTYILRLVGGTNHLTFEDVQEAWALVQAYAKER
jgi:aromatic-L-amino-acid decarboxylase